VQQSCAVVGLVEVASVIHFDEAYYDTAIANPDNGTHECSLILTPYGPKANIINKYEPTDWRLVKFRHIHALLSGNYHVLEWTCDKNPATC